MLITMLGAILGAMQTTVDPNTNAANTSDWCKDEQTEMNPKSFFLLLLQNLKSVCFLSYDSIWKGKANTGDD